MVKNRYDHSYGPTRIWRSCYTTYSGQFCVHTGTYLPNKQFPDIRYLIIVSIIEFEKELLGMSWTHKATGKWMSSHLGSSNKAFMMNSLSVICYSLFFVIFYCLSHMIRESRYRLRNIVLKLSKKILPASWIKSSCNKFSIFLFCCWVWVWVRRVSLSRIWWYRSCSSVANTALNCCSVALISVHCLLHHLENRLPVRASCPLH